MNEDVEAVVGCGGLFLMWVGLTWLLIQMPQVWEFVHTIPTGQLAAVFVGAVGLLMFTIARQNEPPS